jgi:hypothetical protein
MNVFELSAVLRLDSSEYESGLTGAESSTQSLSSKIGSALGTAGKVGAAAVAAVTTAAVGLTTAVVKGTSEVASYGDNIDKMSQKMGLSATAYQEWDAIMRHSGTSIDSMQASMKTLANAVENGNDAFKRLGITEQDLKTLNNEQLFAKTISSLQNVENETERTYLAGQLLGRGATELGALLNMSAEETEQMRQRVHELGGVMSDEAVKAAASYQDSLQDMQTAFQGISRGLMSEFLPAITTVMDGLTEAFSGDGDTGLALISQGIDDFVAKLNDKLPAFIDFGLGIVIELGNAIVENLPQLVNAALGIISTIGNAIINNLPMLIESGFAIITQLMTTIQTSLPRLLQSGLEMLRSIAQGLLNNMPTIINAITNVIMTMLNFIKENAREFITMGLEVIIAFASGLLQAAPDVLNAIIQIIGELISAVIENAPQLLQLGVQYILTFIEGMIAQISGVVSAANEIVNTLIQTIGSIAGQAFTWGSDMMLNFINGIRSWFDQLVNDLKSIGQTVVNFLGFSEPKMGPLSNFHTFAPDMMELFASGIRENADLIEDAFNDSIDLGMPETTSTGGYVGTQTTTSAGGTKYPDTMIFQVVLDKKVIGETAYSFSKQMARVTG